MGSVTVEKIPLINLNREDLKCGTGSWLSVCKEICRALEEYGCFQAKYNKVSDELNKAIFDTSEQLFDLPIHIKLKNITDNNKPQLGYHGQLSARPLYEGFGIDNVTEESEVEKFANTMWPHHGNDSFCQIVHSYSKEMEELHQMVAKMIFDNYGLEKYYDSHNESTTYLLRILKYRVTQETDSNMGLLSHTDQSFLTILHQNQVNGLEIKTKNGDWINVDFAPSTYVVMAGEVIMGWSNDIIDSCVHRVMIKDKETRRMIGLFSFIKGIIKVPEELVDDDKNPLKYKPFEHVGLLRFFLTPEGLKNQRVRTLKAYSGIGS